MIFKNNNEKISFIKEIIKELEQLHKRFNTILVCRSNNTSELEVEILKRIILFEDCLLGVIASKILGDSAYNRLFNL